MLKIAVLVALAIFSPTSVQSTPPSHHLHRLQKEVVNVNVHVGVGGGENHHQWPSRHHPRGPHTRHHHPREHHPREHHPREHHPREHHPREHHPKGHHMRPSYAHHDRRRVMHHQEEEHHLKKYAPEWLKEHPEHEHSGAAVDEAEVDDAETVTDTPTDTPTDTTTQETPQETPQEPAPTPRRRHNFFDSISSFFQSGKASQLVESISGIFNIFHKGNSASVAEIDSALDSTMEAHEDHIKTVETITNHLLFNVDHKLLFHPQDSDEAETSYLKHDYSDFEWKVLQEAQNDPKIIQLEQEIHEAWLNGEKTKLTSLKLALHEILAKVEDVKQRKS